MPKMLTAGRVLALTAVLAAGTVTFSAIGCTEKKGGRESRREDRRNDRQGEGRR